MDMGDPRKAWEWTASAHNRRGLVRADPRKAGFHVWGSGIVVAASGLPGDPAPPGDPRLGPARPISPNVGHILSKPQGIAPYVLGLVDKVSRHFG
jgi:hypothetical protein